jgi:hypothetical protein
MPDFLVFPLRVILAVVVEREFEPVGQVHPREHQQDAHAPGVQ